MIRLPHPLQLVFDSSVFSLVVAAMLAACTHSGPAHAPSIGAGPADVVPGLEVLLTDSLHLIQGKRVGLITNHSGRDRRGTSTIDLLYHAPGVRRTPLYRL